MNYQHDQEKEWIPYNTQYKTNFLFTMNLSILLRFLSGRLVKPWQQNQGQKDVWHRPKCFTLRVTNSHIYSFYLDIFVCQVNSGKHGSKGSLKKTRISGSLSPNLFRTLTLYLNLFRLLDYSN